MKISNIETNILCFSRQEIFQNLGLLLAILRKSKGVLLFHVVKLFELKNIMPPPKQKSTIKDSYRHRNDISQSLLLHGNI